MSRRSGIETETDEQALDRFATPFAKQFLVSPIAMRIRLEKLGLLHRTVARSDGFSPMARDPFFEEIVKCQLNR